MTLFVDPDHWHLLNNPVITMTGPKGGLIEINPFKRPDSPPHPLLRPDAQGIFRLRPRPGKGAPQIIPPNPPIAAPLVTSQHGDKQMQPPSAPASDPQPLPIPISQLSHGINGTRVAISIPHLDAQNQTEVNATPALQNPVAPLPPSEPVTKPTDHDIPVRPISQNGIAESQIRPVASTNGHHFSPPNAAPILANSTRHPNGLSPQQMQHLHTIFSKPPQDFAALQAGYGIPVSYNVNLKPPSAARQMQWISSMQRSPSAVNGQASPNIAQGLPMHSTSANSTPPGTRN